MGRTSAGTMHEKKVRCTTTCATSGVPPNWTAHENNLRGVEVQEVDGQMPSVSLAWRQNGQRSL